MKITLIKVGAIEGDNLVPPLGIMYIAAVLEKAGHIVQLFDIDSDFYNPINKIKKFNPDLIGIGFLTNAFQKSLKLVKKLKQEFPDKKYFCGGVHTTIDPEEVLEDFGVDFVLFGECENSIKNVCKKLKNGEGLNGVRGVIYKENGKIINNGKEDLIENLDEIPFPARHLVNFKKLYLTFPGVIRGRGCKSTTMITSRGCPFNCIYCGSHEIFGRKMRRRSVENVTLEIKELIKNYGIEGIWFVDDTFTLNPKWVIKFCRKLKEEKIKIMWSCHGRVDTLSKEVLKEMKSAGCIQMDFGVESGSDKILKILKKGTNTDMIRKAFILAKNVGIRTLATFMINNPYETKEDLKKTFKLAKDINADFTTFFFTTPYPGTELYDLAIDKGWFDTKKVYSDKWNMRNTEEPVMNLNTFSNDELMKIRGKMQNYFFVKNYLRWYNVVIGFYLSLNFIKKPKLVIDVLKRVLKTGKIDQAFEMLLIENRLRILKNLE